MATKIVYTYKKKFLKNYKYVSIGDKSAVVFVVCNVVVVLVKTVTMKRQK